MHPKESPSTAEMPHGFIASPPPPDTDLNTLFAALLLTVAGAFVGGNLLLLDASVILPSGQIALVCLGLVMVFYALARALRSLAWGLVIAYGLLLTITASRHAWVVHLAYLGAAWACVHAVRVLRVPRGAWGLVVLMGIVGVATALASPGYTTFDMVGRLHGGQVHQDTLYHASIAAMIKQYGVVSTGLHGLVETPYHALSHTLMAGLSRLSGRGVIEVYGVARSVLFIPILLFSVAACSAILHPGRGSEVPMRWLVACLLLVLSPLLFSPWALWDSYFVSESYTVSLGLFLLGLPLLFKWRLTPADVALVLLLGLLVSSAKGSVGTILVGLWLVRALFLPTASAVLAAALAAAVGFGLASWDAAGAASGSMTFRPLALIRDYGLGGGWVTEVGSTLQARGGLSWMALALALLTTAGFFAFHFVLSWVVVGNVTYVRGARALLREPVGLYSLAAAGAGAAIMLLLSVPGGSVYYFSNVAFFVALPTVTALLANRLSGWGWPTHAVLLVGAGLIATASVKGYFAASGLTWERRHPAHSVLVGDLIGLRDAVPADVAFRADPAVLDRNPVSRCSARPFVFPAVTERPWIGVIPETGDCPLRDYGYPQYGVVGTGHGVTGPARLAPGMRVQNWTLAAPDPAPM